MAKIVFGAIVADARRKIGGTVFSKSRFGGYIRKKSSPVQPRTNFQRAVRANFTANSRTFSSVLTVAQVQQWNTFATTHPVKDRFGASILRTGLQWFQSLTRNLHTLGLAFIATPPASLSTVDIGGATLVQSATTPFDISASTTNTPASTEQLAIFAAAALTTGRTFIGKRFRLIAVEAAAVTQPIDITAAYVAKFGHVAKGLVINIQIVNISNASGAKGTPYQASVVLSNPI